MGRRGPEPPLVRNHEWKRKHTAWLTPLLRGSQVRPRQRLLARMAVRLFERASPC